MKSVFFEQPLRGMELKKTRKIRHENKRQEDTQMVTRKKSTKD